MPEKKRNKLSLRRNLLFLATAVAMTIYILWRTFFTLPLEYGLPSFIVGLALLICEIVAGLEAVEQYLNMAYSVRPELPDIPADWYPEVDMFIITHNEDTDILFKTVNAATHVLYPDKNKVHIYICDDTNRPEMRELAERLGVGYFGLSGNKHAKAGNFNNGLNNTKSPLVATFDADMIPHRQFLMRTVPYFFLPFVKKDRDGNWAPREKHEIDENFRVGFIQTPQSFYNPDLFQFNLHAEDRVPNEQDYFFREINVGRNRTNTSIFAGSNTVISRQAISEVGGMAVDTITEDFETGLRIQEQGYATFAINEVLAHGLAPHTIGSLMSQRERWARGCVQSLRHVRPFLSRKFTFAAKFSYLAALIYWWTFFRRFVYIAAPILSALFGVHVVVCTLWQLLIFWLPYYLLNNRTLTILSAGTRTQHWSNLIDTIMFPYLILPLLKETIGLKQKKFVVTQKKKSETSTNMLMMALPHIFLLAASIVGLGICLYQSLEVRSVYNAIIIFWLIVNGKNLALAIFFMTGRKNYRQADRFQVELPVEVEYRGRVHRGLSTDISETGLAVALSFPVYLPDDEPFTLRITDNGYKAELKCEVAHVDPRSDQGWRYSFKIVEMEEADKRQYFQIVYDRRHTLPVIITETLSVLDDFSLNVDRRLRDERQLKAIRRLPRLTVNAPATDMNGKPVIIEDFNYKFAWLTGGGHRPLEVVAAPGVVFKLRPAAGVRPASPKSGALYQVDNWAELLDDYRFNQLVSQWAPQRQGETSLKPAPAAPAHAARALA